MPKALVLWGATGQAIVLAEFVERLGFEIVALFDNNPDLESPLAGVPLERGQDFAAWREQRGETFGLVAIGGEHGRARLEIAARFAGAGVKLATAIHPAAYVARDAAIEDGAQVLAGAIVGARARIGRCAIVNTRASIDHESTIGEGAHVSPGATLAGCVEVGARAFIGTGAVILPRIRIGADAAVGAGAVVTRNVGPGTIVAGVPARPRERR